MIALIVSMLLALTPFAQEAKDLQFDVRARENLMMGKGTATGSAYYDVVITKQPNAGVLIKLPYTRKGGRFTFDLHHRIAMTEDFGLPAEVTTVVEVLTGGTTSIGTYTISETVPPGWVRSATACTDPGGDTTVIAGTATVRLAAGENVTCTYTDTKLGAIQVDKRTVGGDATFSFTGPQNFQITTTAGVGQFALPNLPPGIYTISESVPAGWQLSGLACTDPTNDSTTAGSTAVINVAPGELVTCTYTDARQASVTVEKQTLGGTHKVLLMFSVKDMQLKQWTITDPQGYDTTVALYNLDPTQKIDSSMLVINYARKEIIQ
jgi:hypothetical protein